MSELALKVIAENKRTKAKFLDLGQCGLTRVPDEIKELTWLESLVLSDQYFVPSDDDDGFNEVRGSANPGDSNRNLTDIRAVGALTSLQTLFLNDTQVAGVKPLSGLHSLQSLYLHGTQVSDLRPLSGLHSLQTLSLYRTQVSDPRPLSGLRSLQMLSLGYTQVRDVGPLSGLSSLQTLDLGNAQVSDLTSLIPLLQRNLPARWSDRSWEGPGIYLEGCPLTTPSPEIVEQGNEAILNYFDELNRQQVDHLYEAKMLLLGKGSAGKTSLLRRLYEPDLPLPTDKESTKGIDIIRHDFTLRNGRSFRLNIWDFGGQEIYHATHHFFLTRGSLYVLVDDTRENNKSVSDEGFKYWLDLVDVFGGHSPVLIFQNHKSGRSKAIDFPGIKARYDNVKPDLYGGDLSNPESVEEIRTDIELYAARLEHIGDPLPAGWVKLRAEVEQLAKTTPYISQQQYFDIYNRHMEFDRAKALHLSRYLHHLGVFLHFQDDPVLSDTVILQNEWATAAVFKILDDETVKAKHGRFTVADSQRVWQDSAYANKHLQLRALMQNFELCYELRDIRPQTWLSPQLLSPSRPTSVENWDAPGDLVLRYQYDFLPKGMISRLTVRLHRFVRDPQKAWITGVLFEKESSSLLAHVLPSGNEIELRARGPERKELLSVISSDLDALNESFQGLKDKVQKQIPCGCSECKKAKVPGFFAYDVLLRYREKDIPVRCNISLEEVDTRVLLDGIRINTVPVWAKEDAPPAALRTIRIFLASASELREDCDEFELYFRQQNDDWIKRGLYLEVVRWENFLDAISEKGLQEEYNAALRACDICLCLFATKAGKFTKREFDAAYTQFKAEGKPKIWTYFKKATINTASVNIADLNSLDRFKKKLNALGHYHTQYDSIEHLKRQFRDQLDKLFSQAVGR